MSLAHSPRRHPASLRTRLSASCARIAILSLVAASPLLAAAPARAMPSGGAVVGGSADIAVSGASVTINQTSANAVINWQGFDVGGGESVTFVQPTTASVALNRVMGADPTTILGSLSANGKVFIVNPNGILFGPGAQVNVGGLVASTLGIGDDDFMAGRYHFSGEGSGSVLNRGAINAEGGYVALLGAAVSNQGVISARLGSVVLAAGQAVTLDVASDGLLNVAVDRGAVNALIENGGLIQADGGQVILTAQAAGQLLRTAVNNSGVIQARTLQTRNGVISLLADGESGLVSLSGQLDASGQAPGDVGGVVTATAHHVGLFGAQVLASGDAGGGVVHIGGGYQGADPSLVNASATYMSADSVISADATAAGGGGEVVLWGNDSTLAQGLISARGISSGGRVETSAHALDVVGIRVLAGASNGLDGSWLLDPADVTIGVGTLNGTFVGGVFAPDAGVSSATVDAGALQAALNGGANVTITTTNVGAPGPALGDITVAAALTWNTSKTLTLNADHDIIVNAGSDMTASTLDAGIVLNARNDILVNAPLTASGQNGRLLLTAGGNVTANAALTATALDAVIDVGAGRSIIVTAVSADGGGIVTSVNLHANKDITIGGALSAAGGNVMLRADSTGVGPGALAGTVKFVGPGSVAASTNTAIRFNPNGYSNTATEIAGYVTKVTGALDARAWVFPVGVDRVYTGTTAATLQFRNIAPGDNPNVGNTVTLVGGAANFDTRNVGVLKTVTYSGYTLGGADVARFSLFAALGAPVGDGVTTAAITPAPLTVTANDHAPKLIGDTVGFGGTEFTSIGLVNAEAIGFVTLVSAGATAGVAVGTYAITPSNALANGAFTPSNYRITYVDGQLPVILSFFPTPTSPTPPIPPTPTSPTPTSPTPTSPGTTASRGNPDVTAGRFNPTDLYETGGTRGDGRWTSGGSRGVTDADTSGGDRGIGYDVAGDSTSGRWISVVGSGVRMPGGLPSGGTFADLTPGDSSGGGGGGSGPGGNGAGDTGPTPSGSGGPGVSGANSPPGVQDHAGADQPGSPAETEVPAGDRPGADSPGAARTGRTYPPKQDRH